MAVSGLSQAWPLRGACVAGAVFASSQDASFKIGGYMAGRKQNSEFPEHTQENRRIWEANARWWDDQIGDGNDHQTVLIEPATERLLNIKEGDAIMAS